MINVQVKKNQGENTSGVMRRFTKKMQSSGVLQRVRSLRYFKRSKSKNMQREAALTSLAKKERYQELEKLGLIKKDTKRRGPRRS